jgi:hypothetical protein
MGKAGQKDLRKGQPGGDGNTSAKMPGHEDQIMPMPKSGEHAVNPGAGSKAGVAEGQVTKSN